MFNRDHAFWTPPEGTSPKRPDSPAIASRVPGMPVNTDLRIYFSEIARTAALSAGDERELGWKIINDACAESRERMVRANLRLVAAIAKNYAGRGLSLARLIGEGNIGLLRAVESFDPARGARFSTPASWWIKDAMKRAILRAKRNSDSPENQLN